MKNDVVKINPVVETEIVQDLEPVVVRGSFQFIINKNDDSAAIVKSMMRKYTEEVISAVDSLKRRPVVPIQQYASTKNAAVYIDVDPSFLTKRQGKDFLQGVHFFQPSGSKILRWNLEALSEWLRTSGENDEISEFLSEII